jgi:hypothetical protein
MWKVSLPVGCQHNSLSSFGVNTNCIEWSFCGFPQILEANAQSAPSSGNNDSPLVLPELTSHATNHKRHNKPLFLHRPTDPHVLNTFTTFHGNQNFTIMFPRAEHLYLP